MNRKEIEIAVNYTSGNNGQGYLSEAEFNSGNRVGFSSLEAPEGSLPVRLKVAELAATLMAGKCFYVDVSEEERTQSARDAIAMARAILAEV